jgi:charged multivesicular body protein 3
LEEAVSPCERLSFKRATCLQLTTRGVAQVPEVAATMRNLSKEMMKAGMMEEMLADTLDDVSILLKPLLQIRS